MPPSWTGSHADQVPRKWRHLVPWEGAIGSYCSKLFSRGYIWPQRWTLGHWCRSNASRLEIWAPEVMIHPHPYRATTRMCSIGPMDNTSENSMILQQDWMVRHVKVIRTIGLCWEPSQVDGLTWKSRFSNNGHCSRTVKSSDLNFPVHRADFIPIWCHVLTCCVGMRLGYSYAIVPYTILVLNYLDDADAFSIETIGPHYDWFRRAR